MRILRIYEPATLQVGQTIDSFDAQSVESPFAIHLCQVISRGDKMDFTIQKSVKLGVTCITALFSERCGVKLPADQLEKKREQWEKVVISALRIVRPQRGARGAHADGAGRLADVRDHQAQPVPACRIQHQNAARSRAWGTAC